MDFNAVIVNLESLSLKAQIICVENIDIKENVSEIFDIRKTVLQQQYSLVQVIEKWIDSVKEC